MARQAPVHNHAGLAHHGPCPAREHQKVSITLVAKRLSEVAFVRNFCAAQLRFIIQADCLHTKFCAVCSFNELILASLHAADKEV